MISDITIGQYYSGTSVIHRMDARMKFVLTMALIVILFVCRNFYSLALGLIFCRGNSPAFKSPDEDDVAQHKAARYSHALHRRHQCLL